MLIDEQVSTLAEHLGHGFNCYFHIEKFSIIILPNNELGELDEDLYAKELEELEENFMEYRVIQQMTSQDSFYMMESFVENLEDTNSLKEILAIAIRQPKPFKKFKEVLEDYTNLKDLWKSYRQEKMEDWVLAQVKSALK
jgi:hypothetical protein